MKTGSETKLVIVKSFHSLIWVIFVSIIFFILWSGLTSQISIFTWFAILAVSTEVLILVIFKGSCPLTNLARKYSNSVKENFDIYLPNWLARYNKIIFGILYLVGFVLVAIRYIGKLSDQ